MASALSGLLAFALAQPASADAVFKIKVEDGQTGRGVPLIELRTVNGIRYYTDSNGIAAFNEPGLMGLDVFFHVTGPGYEYPLDGFGFRGKALRATPGGAATLMVKRLNVAERLYRVTGAGIYRDSILAGVPTPLKHPLLNARVLGSDSVLTAHYRNKLYWFWGDTHRPGFPLGNYQVTGATSELPGRDGLDADVGVDLAYFRDETGFAKEMARMKGDGPTWIVSLAVLPDREGRERLYAGYVKVKPPLTAYARGLAVFDDRKQQFDRVVDVDMAAPGFPAGHSFRHADGGVEHVYFANPFPLVRVRARGEDFLRSEEYESYSPLLDATRLDRDAAGRLRYAWRKNVPAIGPAEEAKLVAAKSIQPAEARWRFRNKDTGKVVVVVPHAGSVHWNAFRRRFVMIFVESVGTSFLGEVWYAEAESPIGPWTEAVKIVSHDHYSFYNPMQHPEFDKDGGRIIYFEGTYSNTFSGNSNPTPRYDYNQIMYKLDLSDPRLGLSSRGR